MTASSLPSVILGWKVCNLVQVRLRVFFGGCSVVIILWRGSERCEDARPLDVSVHRPSPNSRILLSRHTELDFVEFGRDKHVLEVSGQPPASRLECNVNSCLVALGKACERVSLEVSVLLWVVVSPSAPFFTRSYFYLVYFYFPYPVFFLLFLIQSYYRGSTTS